MLSMPTAQINELCHFAYISDKETRSDLVGGYIVSESDYTSNFTGALRRIINSNSSTGLVATSHQLSPPKERLSGCDATIIITSNGHYKITTFEAKHPRFSQPNYGWDYAQTSSGLSHFSDQLQRQARFCQVHAIFEMFYCDIAFGKQPNHMQPFGSSCVWHSDAVSFDALRSDSNQLWSRSDLDNLLMKRSYPIEHILREVCKCSEGTAHKVFGNVVAIAREFSLYGPILHIDATGPRLPETRRGKA